jgi:hypothetical protein
MHIQVFIVYEGALQRNLFLVIDNMLYARVAQMNRAWTGHNLFLCQTGSEIRRFHGDEDSSRGLLVRNAVQ